MVQMEVGESVKDRVMFSLRLTKQLQNCDVDIREGEGIVVIMGQASNYYGKQVAQEIVKKHFRELALSYDIDNQVEVLAERR
jgi:hypothetical protein